MKLRKTLITKKIDFVPIAFASLLLLIIETAYILLPKPELTRILPWTIALFLAMILLFVFSELLEKQRATDYVSSPVLTTWIKTHRIAICVVIFAVWLLIVILIPKETNFLIPVFVAGGWFAVQGRKELFHEMRPYTFIRILTVTLLMLLPLIYLVFT